MKRRLVRVVQIEDVRDVVQGIIVRAEQREHRVQHVMPVHTKRRRVLRAQIQSVQRVMPGIIVRVEVRRRLVISEITARPGLRHRRHVQVVILEDSIVRLHLLNTIVLRVSPATMLQVLVTV